LRGIPRKRLPKKRQRTVSTRRRAPLGIPRSNRHGSPNRCFRRKFSRHLRKPQRRPLRSGLEYRAGTRAASARATARIHGTGRRWRNSSGFQRMEANRLVSTTLTCGRTKKRKEKAEVHASQFGEAAFGRRARRNGVGLYLLDEAGPVGVNEGWTKISFRDRAGAVPSTCCGHFRLPPFAKCAKDGATTFLG
jgi:hypothetical protein